MNDNGNMKKRPKSIKVYNQLLQMILEGTYHQGDKLPGENQLAEIVGVSRMTLRQAINILCEDGIIESRHGIGNFVKKELRESDFGLEKLENPIYKSCKEKIDRVETTSAVVSAKEYHTYFNYIFQKPSPVVFGAERYYYGDNDIKAYTHSSVSMDLLAVKNINIDKKEEVDIFLENEIYANAYRISYEVKYISRENFAKDRRIDSKLGIFVMMIEIIYDTGGEIVVYNKHYFPLEAFVLKANFFQR